ncbi:hypothetical protein F5888DRAFT_1635050 [Russula emetica]|nr:hypothetical protein F5888DRAFT_1635050 [Russula emetica]
MRRYKIVAILLILSVISFVLAAPVAVQVREACADAMDGGENVIIVSKKRAGEGDLDSLIPQAQREPSSSSSSSFWSTPSQDQGSSSAPNSASGTHPNPSVSSDEGKAPLLSTSGGTEIPWNPLAEGKANLIQPASSSNAKSVSWGPSKVMILPSGETYSEALGPENEPHPRPQSLGVYQAKVAAQQSQSPQSKKIASKVVGKLKFWRRISGTAGGVVN